MKYAIAFLVLLLLAAGCGTATPTPTPQPEPTRTADTVSAPPTATPATVSMTDSATATPTPAPRPEPTPTPTAAAAPPTATPTTVSMTDSATATPTPAPRPEPTPTPTAAAASPTPAPAAISLTDGTGERLTLESRPVRIACLTEICPDIMAELGLEPVAVNDPLSSDPRFFGDRADGFQVIGGSFFEPNLEDIAAARPDLVIGLIGVHNGLRDALRPIAPLYIVNPLTYQDSIHYLREIGTAMGRPAEAEEAAQRFLAKLEDYKARSPMDRTALVMWGSDVNFGIDTEGSLTGGLLAEVTGYPWPNPPLDQGGHASGGIQFSLEGVLSVDPDVIFIQTIAFPGFQPPPLAEQLSANPLWGELRAVMNGEVHDVSFGLWSTGRGTRSLRLVLDEAMPLLYPDVFGDAAAPAVISLTDGTGERLTLESRPVRIACLTEICPDIMAELGLEPVAVNDPLSSDPRFFGDRADGFQVIGGSFFEPNLEDIAAARPDLVIGLIGVHNGLRDALRPIAPLYIVNPLTYQDSIHYLREIGTAMGRPAEAEEAAQRFLAKLEDYKARSPMDRTALVMWGSDVNFGIDTEGSLTGGLLAEVTGYPWPNPPLDQGGHASGGIQFSLEGVLSVDPDVIFIQTIAFPGFQPPPLAEQLSANPLWGELRAVMNGEVHDVSFGLWSTGRGTRSLGLVLDEAMPLLYPDVFGN